MVLDFQVSIHPVTGDELLKVGRMSLGPKNLGERPDIGAQTLVFFTFFPYLFSRFISFKAIHTFKSIQTGTSFHLLPMILSIIPSLTYDYH